MTRRKKLLVLGAGVANRYTLQEMARVSGVDLVLFDANPASPGRQIAKTFEAIDIADPQAVLAGASRLRVDGVYPMNDHAVRAAAFVAGGLGVRGPSMAAAHAALDKGIMREVWQSWGLRQPRFRVATSLAEVRRFAKDVGLPAVIKPVDCGGGGRGVYVIRRLSDVAPAFGSASAFLKHNNRVIVEEFIDGVETSAEVVRFAGRTTLVAYSDKYKPPMHSRVATRIAYPGAFSERVVTEIERTAGEALLAVGVSEGIGHVELIVGPDETVWLVEMGARAGGGHTFHPIASHVCGWSYPEWIVRHCLDIASTPPVPHRRGAAYHFIYSERPGTLKAIDGLEAARHLPGIAAVEVWKTVGQRVDGLANSMERLGCVVALGETRDEAAAAADAATATARVRVEPDPGDTPRRPPPRTRTGAHSNDA